MQVGQRIAVIGSGLGGLTAAWLLRGQHQVPCSSSIIDLARACSAWTTPALA